MIVADSSAFVELLLANPVALGTLGGEDVLVPHLVDAEVLQSVRGLVLGTKVTIEAAERMLAVWADLHMLRCSTHGLSPRIWGLRDNLTAYDATYVALAESLACSLVTGDARIAQAPGVTCAVVVLPAQPRGGRGKK